jgi:MFS family permease
MVAVFDHTHSALAVAALLFAAEALPAFVAPAVIARVEASRRHGELTGLYFFEGIVTIALAVLLWQFSLPAVLFLAALDGTAALAASALLRAELARAARGHLETELGTASRAMALVPDSEFNTVDAEAAGHDVERRANAALNVAFSISFVAGPLLGGIVVAASGSSVALLIDAATFLIAGALLVDLHPHVEEAAGNSVAARLRTAWIYIRRAPTLRWLLLVDGVALVFFNTGGPIEVTYAKATLHAGDRGFGLLLTAWGAGTVLGSLVFARSLRRPLGLLLSGGTLAVGLAYIGFALAPTLALACVAALIGGTGNGLELPSLISLVQRLTPKNLHGRLMGAVESLSALCVAIGLPLGGALVALSSPRAAFAVVGLGAAATSIALFGLSQGGLEPPARDGESTSSGQQARQTRGGLTTRQFTRQAPTTQ